MNIVYVCREYGPVTGGGIGTYVYNAIKAMQERGHRITLVTDCFDDQPEDTRPPSLRIVSPLPTRPLRQGCFVSGNHEYTYRILDTLESLARTEVFDIIEFAEYGCEGFATIRAKKLLNFLNGTKIIVKLHTPQSLLLKINSDNQLSAAKVCDMEMEDYCVRFADMVTSPSQSLAEYYRQRVAREDIRRCPYPMNLPRLTRPKKMSEKNIKTVRFIGSVQVRKGVDVFIEAAKIMLDRDPLYRFEIYGKVFNADYFGVSYDAILKRNIPQKHEHKIRFMGGYPYHEILEIIRQSCFCVFPSRWENWANVCLEAMSLGCVVIASKEGGMSEMIHHRQNGFLVDPHDPQAIVDIIEDYQDKTDTLEKISASAIERSREICDPDQTAIRMEQNYGRSFSKHVWHNWESNTDLVSVIIPFYNQADFLGEAVDSVKKSRYPNIEIIVVNDGSDDSRSISVFESLQGVRKVVKNNGGLSSARNAGVRASKGRFILPLDADDKIDSNYIATAVEALINNTDLHYVSCHSHNFGEFENAYIPIGYVPGLMPFMNTHGKCTNLYRREVFDKCGGYDEIMSSYEDWDFLISIHEQGMQGDVIPMELFHYRRHYDSMVYQTANPIRADLIQYMMVKHAPSWKAHAPQMAIVLGRLWKDQEILREVAETKYLLSAQRKVTSIQVYWPGKLGYTESNSIASDYPYGIWVVTHTDLLKGRGCQQLRIDPSDKAGIVRIRSIKIISLNRNTVWWEGDADNGFGHPQMMDCSSHREGRDLVIQAQHNDPKIILNLPKPIDQAVIVEATLFFAEPGHRLGYRLFGGKKAQIFDAISATKQKLNNLGKLRRGLSIVPALQKISNHLGVKSYRQITGSDRFKRDLELLNRAIITALAGAGHKKAIIGNLFYDHDIENFHRKKLFDQCRAKRKRLCVVAQKSTYMLEIGFNGGHSSFLCLQANHQLNVIANDIAAYCPACPDLHPEVYVIAAYEALRDIFPGRFRLLVGNCLDEIPKLVDRNPDMRIDFLHIDGAKETYAQDFLNALPILAKKAYVVFDDTQQKAVREVVDKLIAEGYLDRTAEFKPMSRKPGYTNEILVLNEKYGNP
jgi:glycosyltransferase involved in cell wall biosynthesis/predicted O-methyltransferase YrrM